MKLYHRIGFKLVAGFLIVALIPALLVGQYSIYISSRSLLNQELNAQEHLVAGQAREIEAFLSSAKGDVEFLSQSAPIRALLRARAEHADSDATIAALQSAQQEFMPFAVSRQIYYQVRYLDETGQEIIRVDTDASGSRIIPQEKLQDKSGRYYFDDAVVLPRGEIFVSPLDLNRERGAVEVPHKPVIRYATPVYDDNGATAGIVLTNVDAKGFLSILGDTMLVDTNGFYLNHSDPEKAWGGKSDLNHGANFFEDHPDVAPTIREGTSGSQTTADQAISFLTLDVLGSSTQWKLVATRPMGELLESVNRFRLTFLSILAGAILLALLIGLMISSRITRPIKYLTEQAEKVSMGELGEPIEIKGKGEIGLLADAFERMRVSMVRVKDRMRSKR